MDFYQNNAKEYIERTLTCDVNNLYDMFLKYLTPPKKILDIGFGSGRDMIYFDSLGFDVTGIDITDAFVERMKGLGFNVLNQRVEELNFVNYFDGIWACASLLHVERSNLSIVLQKCYQALKNNGIMYCSFKYGDFQGIRNGRYFNDLNIELVNEIFSDSCFKILETKITEDVRWDVPEQKWINIILQK